MGHEPRTKVLKGDARPMAGFLLGAWVYFCLKYLGWGGEGGLVLECTLFPLPPVMQASPLSCQHAATQLSFLHRGREQPAASITGRPRGWRSVGKAQPGAHRTLRRLAGGRGRLLLPGDPE